MRQTEIEEYEMATGTHRFASEGTMTTHEACDILKINQAKLYLRIKAGDFEARKDKKNWLIDRRSFHEYLDNLPSNDGR